MAITAMVEKTVYEFNELSDTAKDNAISKYCCNYDWWDSQFEDFQQILQILGFDVDYKNIQFSLGYSQSDYAAFSGSYRYAAGMVKAIKEYAPKDATLHAIAKDLADIQRRNFYALSAKFTYSDYNGYHIDVEDSRRQYGWTDSEEPEQVIRQALKDLSKWLYNSLRKEYEYRTSYESFEEDAQANGWTFDIRGNIDYL